MPAARSRTALGIFALIGLSMAESLTHFGHIYPDSGGYMANANYFQGVQEPFEFRLIRPGIPFVASYLAYITGLQAAFAIINMVFWCATAILLFAFVEKLTGRQDASLLAGGLFAVAYPMLVYGDAVLTDAAGFFFALAGIHMLLNSNVLKSSYTRVLVSAGIMAVGVLCRETVGCVFAVALLWALVSRASLPKFFLFIAIPIGALFAWAALAHLGVWSFVTAYYAYSAKYQPLTPLQRVWTWLYTIRVGFLPTLLLLALIGLVESVRDHAVKTYLAILAGVSGFLLVIPGVVDYRFTFLLFPAIIPLAAIGTLQLSLLVSRHLPIQDTGRTATILALIIFIGYAIETNWLALRFVSFP